jgi:Motility related/secretion protein
MLSAVALPLVALLVAIPGLPRIPGLPGFGVNDLKKLRHKTAAPLDTLPPAWKPVSRLALENQFVLSTLRPIPSGPVGLKLNTDPRKMRFSFDPDSGAVRYVAQVDEFSVSEPSRMPVESFTRELTRQNFQRLWAEQTRAGLLSGPANNTATRPTGAGMTFEFPSPLPAPVQSLLGPGGPSLTVSGSENIRLSGTSNWTNQQVGLLGQRRSLFPSLDMQQDLDIHLEGRLSDRVGVNLLQNSANQIPLENRIAINYKGDEDDLVQALDLGNTNLSLPGTQYVSYSGKNEGLFGMKATTRLGPLDFTVLASKQEGRSERAGYQGGASRQNQLIYDKDYVRGVYFFLYDPNLAARDINESSIRLYLNEGYYNNDAGLVRGRAFVDPASPCTDTTTCPEASAVHGSFRLLRQGADQDYELLTDVYGPNYMVIRLRSALTGEKQSLAVTYAYRLVGAGGVPFGDSVRVGGTFDPDKDGIPALRMMLLRPPTDELKVRTDGYYESDPHLSPFYPVRELELRNFYQLQGQRIDPKSFDLHVWQGDDQPPLEFVQPGVPYLEAVGLDNYNESGGFTSFDVHGHDGLVDGTAFASNSRGFVDFERGTLFLPDLRPFAPRLAVDSTGRPFERAISAVLFRRDSLVAPPPATGGTPVPNASNPAIYDKAVLLSTDRTYTIAVNFTAARAGNEITLGRTNIIEGSDVVTINGQALVRDRDYRIDYDLGRVTLIRQLGPADQLNIDYSYAPLFQQAGRTLIGNAFSWQGREKSIGGAFMYESKGAQDLRPRLGEEPSRMVIGDLNTEWRFKPEWVTRMVDMLPGVRTTAPSELNVQAEVGGSLPNPNTRNEIFVDDMEGVRDAVSLSLGPERWHLTSVPQRTATQTIDDPSLAIPEHDAEIHWFSPINTVHERDLKPSLTNAQGAQNSRQVLALSLPRRPTTVTDPAAPLWAGLTYLLDPTGLDLTRSQFIELWVDDFRDFHNGSQVDRVRGKHVKLHIDLGAVSEDQQRAPNIPPNGLLDTEDANHDNQLVVNDEENEDTGVDNRLDGSERPSNADSLAGGTAPDLVTVTATDSTGDDFDQPNTTYEDWDPRKWRKTNGTEDNKNVVPTPDTEDLDLSKSLEYGAQSQRYYEYTIDLGDDAQRYLVTDVHASYTKFDDGKLVPDDNGWRRYRIPIADSLRQAFGSPDLRFAKHVRIWLEDVQETDPPPFTDSEGKPHGRPFVVIGGLDIVGSRWIATDLDSLSIRAGTTMTLNSVNTVDNADVYRPPFDPGETRNGNQEVTRREQSMALEFTELANADTLEAYKTFSLDEDYSRYGKLDFYAAAFEIPGYDPVSDSLDYFVRFASDEKGTSYYEYRSRMPASSSPGAIDWQRVTLTLTDLSNLKLRSDFPTTGDILYRAPGKNPGEEYVIRGRPSFTRLRRISFGVINRSGKSFPSGQLWFDELRGADVAKDPGIAQRVSLNGRLSNLLTYNLGWNGRDENFQSVGESRGSGSTTDQLNFQTGLDLHRFFESTRILLPVNYTYSRSGSRPRFTAGDDVVRSGVLADASDTRVESRTYSASYSRTWSDRANPFIRYTAGGITANISESTVDSRNPVSTDVSRSTQAAVNYSIAPRQLLRLPIPTTKLGFFPLPERFYWNYSVVTSQASSFQRQLDTNGVHIPLRDFDGRQATINYGADSRPFDFFHHSFTATRNLQLPDPLLERVGFINFGRLVNWSQQMDARYQPQKYGAWLNPSVTWTSRYGQNNGPELSPNLDVLAVSNSQSIALSWALPFDQLRGMGMAALPDTSRNRKSIAPWRTFLSRLGPLATDASFNTSSGHSRMLGAPSFLYLTGFKQDPGFGDDSTSRVHRDFGNRSDEHTEWRVGGHTTLDLGMTANLITRGDYSEVESKSNGVPNKNQRIRFPDLEVNYGRIPDVLGLKLFLVNPALKTAYSRSQAVDFSNSETATSVSTSSQWQPLLEIGGDLKNGTRCLARLERRITKTENRLIGSYVTTDRNTNFTVSLNRSYSKGQKVSFLGKETTVRSNVNLGISGAYEKQSGETIQPDVAGPQNLVSRDRVSINAQGGYSFSNNLTGNLVLGFGQDRNLVIKSVNRNMRVELRAQFTF